MDYLKRKKEQGLDILKEAYVGGYYSAKFGKPPGFPGELYLNTELNKLIDQVYKRGLKDGRKGDVCLNLAK